MTLIEPDDGKAPNPSTKTKKKGRAKAPFRKLSYASAARFHLAFRFPCDSYNIGDVLSTVPRQMWKSVRMSRVSPQWVHFVSETLSEALLDTRSSPESSVARYREGRRSYNANNRETRKNAKERSICRTIVAFVGSDLPPRRDLIEVEHHSAACRLAALGWAVLGYFFFGVHLRVCLICSLFVGVVGSALDVLCNRVPPSPYN